MPDPFYPDSLLGRLDRHAHTLAGVSAYTFLPERGDPQTLTFAQLAARVRSLAAAIRPLAKPGDRAVLFYPQGLEFVAGFLACLAAGVIAVPAYPPRRNRHADRLDGMLADCSPSLLLATAAVRATFPDNLSRRPVLETDLVPTADAPAWDPDLVRPDRPAFLQYTSGSTGSPRGVLVTHGNITANERMIEANFGHKPWKSGSQLTIVVSWLPLFHDMGLIGGALQPLFVGFPAVILPPVSFLQEPVRWLRAISDYGGTTAGAPNFAYDLCVRAVTEEQKAGLDLSTLRVLYNGAEPVRGATLDRFAAAFAGCGFRPEAFLPCYGLAEATLFVSGGPHAGVPKRMTVGTTALEAGHVVPAPFGQEVVSCGLVAPGTEVVAVDPATRRLTPADRVGALWVKSGSVTAGYWNNASATTETFGNRLADGSGPYLDTGDLGFVRGGEVYVTGRVKDVIIVRGRNLYPQDVEAAVGRALPWVAANGCAAFALDAAGTEGIGVVVEAGREVVRAARTDPARLEAAVARVREAVAAEFEVSVDRVAVVRPGGFPRTSSGKVQRRACRDGLLTGELDTIHEWPTTVPTESDGVTLVAAQEGRFAPVLNDILLAHLRAEKGFSGPRVLPDESLLGLGVDSVGAAGIAAAVADRTGCHIPPEVVYEFPTLRGLAAHLDTLARPAVTGAERRTAFRDALVERDQTARSLRAEGRYFYDAPFEQVGHGVVEFDGRPLLMLSSFSYLGLVGHPEVRRAVVDSLDRFGTGAHGGRLLAGTTTLHRDLERRLAAFVRAEDSVVFPAGFQTNVAAVGAIVGPGDVVVGDEFNHASIVDGCRFSGAEFLTFRHNDLAHLEERLRGAGGRHTLVVVDAVYSMEGDVAPLPAVVGLCRRHGALLMVDEAHSLVVLGRTGRGVQEHFGLPADAIDFKMGTLSKALGSQGGFVATSAELVSFLRHNARGYMFSTASPAPVVAAALAGLDLLEREPERVGRLRRNAVRFRHGVRRVGFRTTGEGTPIVPLLCADREETLDLVAACRRLGLFVVPVFYPVVPMNAPRVRVTLTAGLSDADIDTAVRVLGEAWAEVRGGRAGGEADRASPPPG